MYIYIYIYIYTYIYIYLCIYKVAGGIGQQSWNDVQSLDTIGRFYDDDVNDDDFYLHRIVLI
jgi:hypothetical protein